MSQKLSVIQPSSNQLETAAPPQNRSWMRENLPPSVDPDRYEKGVAHMKKIESQVSLWPNQIKMVLSDSQPISWIIDNPNGGGDTPTYVFANTFAVKIRQFCDDIKIKPPENWALLEKAIGAVIDNRWMTMTDILFFGRSLQKGGFKAIVGSNFPYPENFPITNGNVSYPKHFQNFTEGWLNECFLIYRIAKNIALSSQHKEAERAELEKKSTGEKNPELQDEIDRLTWERMVKIEEVKQNLTPLVEPPPPVPDETDCRIFTRFILPELKLSDRLAITAMRNQKKRQGLAIWVLIDDYLKMEFQESLESYREFSKDDPQALAEFYAEIAKQKNGEEILEGIDLAFQHLENENK